MLYFTSYTIIKTHPDSKQHIAVMHRQIRFIGTMHTQHANKLIVRGRIRTQSHQCIGNWITELTSQLTQLLMRFTHQHTTTGVYHRLFRLCKQFYRFAYLANMPAADRCIGAHGNVGRVFVGNLYVWCSEVLRDIHHHRPGPAGCCHIERLLHHCGNLVRAFNHEVVLYAGTRAANSINFLKSISANEF